MYLNTCGLLCVLIQPQIHQWLSQCYHEEAAFLSFLYEVISFVIILKRMAYFVPYEFLRSIHKMYCWFIVTVYLSLG